MLTYFELILFIIIGLIGFSIIYSTLKTGISPMVSSSKARQAMFKLLEGETGPFIDLGSGWGTLIISVARKYPHQPVIGYELSWFPWLISVIYKHCLHLDNLQIYRQDFNNAPINNASVILCYLFPGAMLQVQQKLSAEISTQVLIISNTFAMPSLVANQIIQLNDFYRSPIYLYRYEAGK